MLLKYLMKFNEKGDVGNSHYLLLGASWSRAIFKHNVVDVFQPEKSPSVT